MLIIDPRTLDQSTLRTRPRGIILDPETLRRIRFLGDKDRLLIELTFNNGLTRRQLAAALNRAPGNISRRLRAIARRLADPLVLALTSASCTLPPEHRQIGIEHFLHRCPLKQLTRRHALPYPQLKQMIEYIRGWHRGLSAAAARGTEPPRP
jgi:hypothetical protein